MRADTDAGIACHVCLACVHRKMTFLFLYKNMLILINSRLGVGALRKIHPLYIGSSGTASTPDRVAPRL